MSLSATQIALRRGRISSSDIAGVVGLSPWITPYGAWLRVTGQAHEEAETDDALSLGNDLEDGIARAAARRIWPDGADLSPGLTLTVDDWIAATPDRFVRAAALPALLECKLVGSRQWDAWRDGPPDYVQAQVQWQLAATAYTHAWIGALIGGTELRTYEVREDIPLQRGLVALARPWWERHVRDGVPPPVDHSPEAAEHVARLFPAPEYGLRQPTDEELITVRWLHDARKLRDIAVRDYAHACNTIRQTIGPHEGLQLADGRLTWRRTKGSASTDWQALARRYLAEESPEVAERLLEDHTRITPGYRRLAVPRAWWAADKEDDDGR